MLPPGRTTEQYARIVAGLEAGRLDSLPTAAELAAILVEEILAERWEAADEQDAAQVLIGRLERVSAGERAAR
jgi:hypothetical protein